MLTTRIDTHIDTWIRFLIRWRRWGLPALLLLWGLCAGFMALDKRPLPRMGSEGARASESAAVHARLAEHFELRQENTLGLVTTDAVAPELMRQLESDETIQSIREIPRPEGREHHLYALQMRTDLSIYEVEAQVPRLRGQLQHWRERSGGEAWLTGQQAFFYDLGQASRKDTSRAERLGLLLAFCVLIGCFGSLVGASLPLALGITTLLGIQLLMRLLQLGSNQTSNILNSMVGLGLSIDYALFMVSRFREERAKGELGEALGAVLRQTGRTVIYSAAVMIAALLILMIPDVDALRGTVLNLLLVVVLAALNALVMLPLLLAALDGALDRPRWLSRWVLRWHGGTRWHRLASHVSAHPIRYGLLSLVLLGSLAWPAHKIQLWEPLQSFAPPASESMQGFAALAADGWGGELQPVLLLVESPDPLLEPAQLQALYTLSTQIAALPEVASVKGLVNPNLSLRHWQGFFAQLRALQGLAPDPPLLKHTPEGDLTLISVQPRNIMDISASYRLVAGIRELAAAQPQLKIGIGGTVARARSFTVEMYRHLPLMIPLILLSILVLLAFYLKSVVLPLKAGIMNFLPILSAFGLMVWAYQLGGFASYPGITNLVPLTLFCIVFGLSMDYEVLILSRIDEAWRSSGDVRTAVVEGLGRSSGLITGAALILLGVFAPGLGSSSQIVRELSLGITATILLDATIVRLFLVPSLMMLMGKWNWWNPWEKKAAGSRE